MIKKYSKFLNESMDLILESDVTYSADFKKIIKKITSHFSNIVRY